MATTRARSRKVGLKRMDAVVDNLTPMGFSPYSIRYKVKSLLRVYGGDEAWPFIEEASYKLVIESLLEDQEPTEDHVETGDNCKSLLEGTSGQGGMTTEPPQCGPSHTLNERQCSDHQDAALPSSITVMEPASPLLAEKVNTASIESAKVDVAGLTDAGMHSAPSGSKPSRKRKPCYGWIGSKDDNDIIYLKPYPIG